MNYMQLAHSEPKPSVNYNVRNCRQPHLGATPSLATREALSQQSVLGGRGSLSVLDPECLPFFPQLVLGSRCPCVCLTVLVKQISVY